MSKAVSNALVRGYVLTVKAAMQYDAVGDRLWLEAGTNRGSVGFFPVDGSKASAGGAALSAPAAALSGGHSTVRHQHSTAKICSFLVSGSAAESKFI